MKRRANRLHRLCERWTDAEQVNEREAGTKTIRPPSQGGRKSTKKKKLSTSPAGYRTEDLWRFQRVNDAAFPPTPPRHQLRWSMIGVPVLAEAEVLVYILEVGVLRNFHGLYGCHLD